MQNYYQLLGVSRLASREEIKAAYHAKALKLHPDRNTEPDATEKMQMLVEAYQTLSDQSKKSVYDEQLNSNNSKYGCEFFPPSDSKYGCEFPLRSDSKKISPFFWHIKLLQTQYELLSFTYKHALMSICSLEGNLDQRIELSLTFIPMKITTIEKIITNNQMSNEHDFYKASAETERVININLNDIINYLVEFKRATEEQGSEMKEKFKIDAQTCLNTICSMGGKSTPEVNLGVMIGHWTDTFKEDLNKILTSNSEAINNHDRELKERIKQRKQKAAEEPVELPRVFCSLM